MTRLAIAALLLVTLACTVSVTPGNTPTPAPTVAGRPVTVANTPAPTLETYPTAWQLYVAGSWNVRECGSTMCDAVTVVQDAPVIVLRCGNGGWCFVDTGGQRGWLWVDGVLGR